MVGSAPRINSSTRTSVLCFLQSHEKCFFYNAVQTLYRWKVSSATICMNFQNVGIKNKKKNAFSNHIYNSCSSVIYVHCHIGVISQQYVAWSL